MKHETQEEMFQTKFLNCVGVAQRLLGGDVGNWFNYKAKKKSFLLTQSDFLFALKQLSEKLSCCVVRNWIPSSKALTQRHERERTSQVNSIQIHNIE